MNKKRKLQIVTFTRTRSYVFAVPLRGYCRAPGEDNITFTFQDKATDTVAVDVENNPFRTENDSLLFRPAGHGALIYNLNKLEEEVVSIKNIDNVATERFLPETATWKKVLFGKALELRDTYAQVIPAHQN